MKMRNKRLAFAAWLGLLVAGCSQEHSELGGDSSTHWLLSCGTDDDCGGLSCVCGVCSSQCSQRNECAMFGANASCVEISGGSCQERQQLCDRECTREADCGGGAPACVAGRCRKSGTSVAAGVHADAGDQRTSPEAGSGGLPDVGTGVAGNCAPQRAASNGSECALTRGYAWNGNACEEVVCGCTGEDCASIYPERSACETALATCISPETQCSGLPWYQCFDHCPDDFRLLGGERRLAAGCQGDCAFFLSFHFPVAPGESSCVGSLIGDLRVGGSGETRFLEFELSPAAFEEVMRLSRALDALALDPATACANCSAFGRDAISLYIGTSPASFYYDHQQPPLVLREVDRFVQQLMDQANVCAGDMLSRCSSLEPAP